MSTELKLDGMEDLFNKIEELGKKGAKIENDAIKKAAELVLEDAKTNAPVDTGKGKDGLKISKIRNKNGSKYVNVGIEKGDNSEIFYMKFHEWGTSKMSAHPFLQPAYEKNKDKIIEIIKEEMRKGLGLE